MACLCDKNCIFCSEFRDMGASTPLCTRYAPNLSKSISAYGVTQCPFYITPKMVMALQAQGIIATYSLSDSEV